MNRLRRAWRMDCFRCFHSPLYYISILLFLLYWYTEIAQDLALAGEGLTILHLFDHMSIGALLAAVPFATAFCEEYKCRMTWYCIPRSSLRAYACSKVICTALFSALASLLAALIFMGIFALRFPLVDANSSLVAAYVLLPPYGALLIGAHPILYFVCLMVCQALMISVLASVALLVSCLLPNIFATLAAPVISYYVIINACTEGTFSPYRIFVTRSIDMGGPVLSLFYALGYAICCIGILGVAFYILLKRRVEYGSSI